MVFVKSVIAVMVGFVFVVLDILNELVAALGNDLNFVTIMFNVLVGK